MIGIRREDKNVWERRAPLTPDHVSELIHVHGVRVAIQRSRRRIFPDVDYQRAGAVLADDLADCTTVFGIKEIPPELFQPGKVYLYFSHTTKGQPHNMPALRRLLELGCTLLDYEEVVDERRRRLIFFGKHAGYAGMIDALWALGRRFAAEGHDTPLEEVRLAHDYGSLDEATHHLSRLGERLRHTGLPEPLRPLIVDFTGSGNVARGAWEIYDRLPTQEILPEELPSVASDPDRPRNILYRVHFGRPDRIERIERGPVDLDEFDAHPERYRSAMPRWLPHLTVLVHGALWRPGQPRLVGREDLRRLWAAAGTPRLRLIADISCDIAGGIEATVRPTSPGAPVYVFDPDTGQTHDGVVGPGPVVLAVDNLPCQLPLESSQHFGDGLHRFVPVLARADWTADFERLELPEPLRRAVVVHRGALTPRFAWLQSRLDKP